MSRLLFLHHIDEMAGRGCGTPFCTHDHSDGLFLTPRCHPGVGVRLEYVEAPQGPPCRAAVGLRCWKCHAPVAEVALTTGLELTPACRHGSALDVRYYAGNLTVSCRRCHTVQGTADVAPYVPA